jgi:hypothetical protein
LPVARYPVNEDRSRSQFCRLERVAGCGITGVRRSIGESGHFAPRDRGPVGRVSAVIVREGGRSSNPEALIESKGHGALDTSHAEGTTVRRQLRWSEAAMNADRMVVFPLEE